MTRILLYVAITILTLKVIFQAITYLTLKSDHSLTWYFSKMETQKKKMDKEQKKINDHNKSIVLQQTQYLEEQHY